ncbi:MAG: NAD-dependent epimerase/dehydratase [Solirubrobacterales bacterium]|nr:NAD-dependent epimerase/dehydratase [Solirubrobacterales bacterium]
MSAPVVAASAPMQTAFVTGSGGLLGYWLVQALLERSVRVVVLERTENARSALRIDGLAQRCTTVKGDLLDAPLLDRAIAEHEVDTVFHLAAQPIVGAAVRSPVSTFETNVRGTWLLLESARTCGVSRVVVASTDRVYGRPETLPYTEDMPLDARQPYEVSKAAADLVARSSFHTYGLPVAVTRFSNVYGGGDLNHSRLVPELTAAALAGRAPVIRSDGSPERDYLYAQDAAAAYLAIADALACGVDGGAHGEAFNAGGGAVYSVRQVTDMLIRVAGADVAAEYRGAGAPAGEVDRRVADSSKLRALTGWAPQVQLEEGLRRTVDWYRERPGALAP